MVYGGEVTGVVNMAANGDLLRLVWIDEAERVAGGGRLRQTANLIGGPFSFKMPMGTFGHQHKIALIREFCPMAPAQASKPSNRCV